MAGRGQSGVRMWKKAAIVKPVEPTVGKDGFKQPAYLRSHSAAQTSRTLKAYQSFIRKCMQAKKKRVGKFEGRPAVQAAFRACAHAWKRRVAKGAASEEDFDFYEGNTGEEDIFWE